MAISRTPTPTAKTNNAAMTAKKVVIKNRRIESQHGKPPARKTGAIIAILLPFLLEKWDKLAALAAIPANAGITKRPLSASPAA